MLTPPRPAAGVLFSPGRSWPGSLGTSCPPSAICRRSAARSFRSTPFRQLLAEPGIWHVGAAQPRRPGSPPPPSRSASCSSSSPAWPARALSRRVQHLSRRCSSVPHAAAAFGLAFLIAPSGLIARLLSPELTGWERPPDLLIVNDPLGLVDDRRADRQGDPVPAADHAGRAAAGRPARARGAVRLARLWPHRRLPLRRLAAALPADPAGGLRRPRLLDLGGRRRARSSGRRRRRRSPCGSTAG